MTSNIRRPAAPRFKTVAPGSQLTDQVAAALAGAIRSGQWQPGDKLPTEAVLEAQFGVSRTVVREAVARLKSLDLVDSRQGSGVYVRPQGFVPLSFDARHAVSREAVVQIVEVRRALEAEMAGLAAQRRSAAEVRRARQALTALDKAVRAGGDGVAEDVAFHGVMAEAARNPFLLDTLQYLGQFQRAAIRVTRANEARRADFARQVSQEHERLFRAIEAQDAGAARRAATAHLNNAIRRIESADAAFWQQEGEALARTLVRRRAPGAAS